AAAAADGAGDTDLHEAAVRGARHDRRQPAVPGPRSCRDGQDVRGGGGGTAVRRNGLRVLLCCFNRQLGYWLKEETAGVDGITAAHLHSYMAGLVPSARPAARGDDAFFTEELPDLALEALLERDGPPFDVLVIDEAQDLMRESYLNVLDSSLRGGLSSGQWLAFGDFTRQALYDSDGEGMEALYERTAGEPAV